MWTVQLRPKRLYVRHIECTHYGMQSSYWVPDTSVSPVNKVPRLQVEPEQALVQEALAEEPKQEPQDLVQDAQLEEPKQQPQDNVVASHALAVDFSGVLEDDWSDVHVKEDWLVPADEGENTVDISAVFEADDICIDTTLAQPNGSDVRLRSLCIQYVFCGSKVLTDVIFFRPLRGSEFLTPVMRRNDGDICHDLFVGVCRIIKSWTWVPSRASRGNSTSQRICHCRQTRSF